MKNAAVIAIALLSGLATSTLIADGVGKVGEKWIYHETEAKQTSTSTLKAHSAP